MIWKATVSCNYEPLHFDLWGNRQGYITHTYWKTKNQKQVPLKELKKTWEEVINTLMLTLDTADRLQDPCIERYREEQTWKIDIASSL